MSFPAGAIALAALAFAVLPGSRALAACSPASGVATGAVTCSGATTDQDAPDGYGTGAQNNLTITVQSGATVTGTDNGFNLNTGNTINNSGTVSGGLNGVLATNAGTSITITNFGTIQGTGAGSTGISADTLTLTNHGTVSGDDNGVFTNGTAAITNYGTITGGSRGLDIATANVVNYGTIRATGNLGVGISMTTGTVDNAGTISSSGTTGRGISISGTGAQINNSGTISVTGANAVGIFFNSNTGGTVTNTGLIEATRNFGILAQNGAIATINNSGIIRGVTALSAQAGSTWYLTNYGTIHGTGGTAINFSATSGNTLNLMPGGKIIGDIVLGTPDTVNIYTGGGVSTLYRFGICGCGGLTDTGSRLNIFGSAPFVVSGNNVVVIDPTALSHADKTLMFYTGNVSSLLGSRFGSPGGIGTPGATAFAAAGASENATGANAAFASAPGLAYAGSTNRQDMVPAAMAYDRATGTTVWSKAFIGKQHQSADTPTLQSSTLTYGAALGIDRSVTSDLLLGVYLGAGYGKLDVQGESQTVSTDYVFGGVYGRFDWIAHFFDVAVSGGHLANTTRRKIFNNAAPNGEETATADYNGYFVSPEIAYGIRIPLAGNATLTPTGRIRYLAGHLNGYAETGSSANLTVNGRTVQNLEERFELVLSHLDPLAHGWLKTSATLGVLAQERLGGTSINTVLLGQNLSFTAAGDTTAAGIYAGLAFDYRAAKSISLFAALDGTAMTDKSVAFTAKGGTRVSF